MKKGVVLIGYSGHSYVIYDILQSMNKIIAGYCEGAYKENNPFHLVYFGSEKEEDVVAKLKEYDYFIGIGSNRLRKKIYEYLTKNLHPPINAIHSSSVISSSVLMKTGIMIAASVTVNALSKIGTCVICNTSSVIEHECTIGNFSHIAPGAVLCGNVSVGENCFIGANSVVKEGITIGNNVTIGAGTVVIKNIEDNATIVGNPQRKI